MSRTVESQAIAAEPLQMMYACIQDEMRQVETILQREMRSDFPFVDELVRYGCLLGGKRLRPALLLLTAKACGRVTPDHLTLAAVVEMIHTATLVHDDVLDQADMRRHLATVNARWDDESSVLLGDFLFTHAFYLASTLESTLACRLIGKSTNVVCEGEIRQKGSRGDYSLDREEYFQILDAKTAELCACCCQLGAHFAGAAETLVRQLASYGRYLGVAFQIADDLLDVAGDECTAGKSLGTDLQKQKPTLPVIRALELASPRERLEMIGILNGDSQQRLGELEPFFERHDSINYTRKSAQHYAARAAEQLADLPPSEPRSALHAVTHFVVDRTH